MFYLGASATATNYWRLSTSGAGAVTFVSRNTIINNAATTADLVAGVWGHACGVGVSATERYAYLDGGNVGSNVDSSTPVPTICAMGMHRSSVPAAAWDGAVAHAAVWRVALSAAEVALLAAGADPRTVQPQDLAAYWPLNSATWEREWKGRFNLMPSDGAITWIADPPQFRPARRRLWAPRWLDWARRRQSGASARWEPDTTGTFGRLIVTWAVGDSGAITLRLDSLRGPQIDGRPIRLVTRPSKGRPPSDSYDLTLTDEAGSDVLQGAGANRDTANAETAWISETASAEVPVRPITIRDLIFNVANAGAGGAGTAVLYVALGRQDWY